MTPGQVEVMDVLEVLYGMPQPFTTNEAWDVLEAKVGEEAMQKGHANTIFMSLRTRHLIVPAGLDHTQNHRLWKWREQT